MRKLLLLIASLTLFTVSGWAAYNTHVDWYNQVLSMQTEQFQLEKNAIGQPPVMLAGNNMITDGQQPAADLFGMQPPEPSHSDFYNAVLVDRVEEYKSENASNSAGPTLLAGNNMITGEQASPGREDFYNQTLSAKLGEFKAESNSAGGHIELANMITGEQVVIAPEQEAAPQDFYNQVLSAQVDQFSNANSAFAASASESAESQEPGAMPGSIASNVGGGSESDWYSKTVAAQAELNRRIKKAELQ